ncbi:MAG TPA: histidine phosphatase family protein [Burkholderiales bacterium]|nr:histidine phosphatase family protein [Burkholderiales bacterium]
MSVTTKIPTPTCLYLVRHGETEWSLSGRHTGRTDIALTERGKREARKLARRLRAIQFAHVLTSPRQRAQQTCRLAGLGAAAEIEPDLAEWDYGDYEGQRSADIRKVRAGWNIFRDGCPRGEMPAQVADRADRLIARLRALEGNVALFSHGQFGCVLAARWIGLPPGEAQHFVLGPASLSILGFGFHHPEVAVIALWNAASSERMDAPHSRSADTKTVNPRALERWENEGGEIKPEAVPALRTENAG